VLMSAIVAARWPFPAAGVGRDVRPS
jgi:hypothetical protein